MDTTLLEQELAPLNAQVEQTRKQLEMLEGQLHVVEAELETFSADRQRFDALREVCQALDKLKQLEAVHLFWEGIPGAGDTAGHLEQVRGRVARFEGEISGILEKEASLRAQTSRHRDELEYLSEEVRIAYDREERRQEEFVVEREISPVPYRPMLMPWTKEGESEKHFRRSMLVALLVCLFFGSVVPLVSVPVPDRSAEVVEIPERLAMLVKKEPPKPLPLPKPEPKPLKEEPEQLRDMTKPRPEQPKPDKPQHGGGQPQKEVKVAGGGGGAAAARKKAESVGVLAFKDAFKGLMDETPVARLGTEAHLKKTSARVAGQAVAQRSLVAMQAQGGGSGGIGNYGVSRNLGNGGVDGGGGGIGKGWGGGSGNGVGFARVESAIAGMAGGSPRPLSDGPGPGRTDEEIQIVFDRYKATLYRIYNTELRKDPTLRGKMLLRIAIETNGSVSMCKVESTDLNSPELVANIIARIMRFNFGQKEGVPKMVILYPIDFLPAA